MKRAAVITLHSVCNYGTQLQVYATQEKLKEYFEEVCFIDYRRPDTYGIGLIKTFTKGNPLKALIVLPTLLYWKKIFGGFLKKNICLSAKTYLKEQDFDNFQSEADVYFSGSDQVWNGGWNKGVIAPFYLSFVDEDKIKAAFSSSFGREYIDSQEVDASRKYISRFDYISVREKSGVNILEKQYGYIGATQLVDPTLAMPSEFWRKVSQRRNIKEKYILIYNLERNKKFDLYAVELAKKTGLQIIRLCTRLDQVIRMGKSIIMPEIFEFVWLIDHAEYVLTDSFHATAFSINMGTQPICVYPTKYSCRIAELLEMFDMEQCHVADWDDLDVVNRKVDWKSVNEKLKVERERIDSFLTKIVSNEDRNGAKTTE